MKTFHFIGNWLNGDPLVVCVFGRNKKDAWFRFLKARKDKKFVYEKGDNFSLKYMTEEELAKKNPRFLKYGHTQYIVKGRRVDINLVISYHGWLYYIKAINNNHVD